MGKYEVNPQLKGCSTPVKRILICGLGSIGRKHARILHQNFPDIELSALRSGHGVECPESSLMTDLFVDLDEAIGWQPDGAIVSSPAPFHQQYALCLARQKIPLLIEKPLGVGSESQTGWDELLQHSQSIPVVVGYILRYGPCPEYIQTMLAKQALGKVIEADFYCGSWLPDWRPGSDYRSSVSSKKAMGGGALLELSHEIDLAFWLFKDFELAFASLGNSSLLEVNVEDQVLLAGRSSICSSITIRLNMCTRPSRRNVVIRCENGEINWDLLEGKVDVLSDVHQAQSFRPSFEPDSRFHMQAQHFLKCIYEGVTPRCTLNDGLQVLNLINQARLYSLHQSGSQEVLL